LPMEIFSRIRTNITPDLNALSVVLLVTSGVVVFVAEWIRSQSEKKRSSLG
jgi:spermidine/putrescine transport system permease protein